MAHVLLQLGFNCRYLTAPFTDWLKYVTKKQQQQLELN